ncbi:hypothetical protein [Spirosoma oryzicola]|uniref:hypothetical protein n=1 Tax=Spirosoma oryzicola TaxID=2898794 RepID=UPI001E2A2C8B|nr:hypothetical protein [Spirosoma oryzicola]UHG89706.1 hypothetical protein LQ777_15795 [Spirosoma oryzicola]
MRHSSSILLLIGFFITLQLRAQGSLQTTRDLMNHNGLSAATTNRQNNAGKLLGSPYLDTTWQTSNVKFYGNLNLVSDSLANVPVRLDLYSHDVEVRAGANDVRVAKGPSVKYIVPTNPSDSPSRFVNVREFKGEADALAGFFEQIAAGKLTLLQYPSVYVKRANFNPAMGTGSKDDELIPKNDWYIVQNGKANRFSPGRKSLLELMADKKEQIETYLKTEKPDLKTKPGLSAVFAYYNSL